ncbi:MAG: hypothetical protein F6K40_06580 [Okeania sp. SIO3I5]|nr:hypothetical protein [Okeania sp. SIO3I5]
MNQVTNDFIIVSQSNNHGTYNPQSLPTTIIHKDQISFTLQGSILTGSEGKVTYEEEGTGKRITFAFKCPRIDNNSLSIPLNNTSCDITYYGSNQFIEWNPHGTNWGPSNNFPKRGHPLHALFVISS